MRSPQQQLLFDRLKSLPKRPSEADVDAAVSALVNAALLAKQPLMSVGASLRHVDAIDSHINTQRAERRVGCSAGGIRMSQLENHHDADVPRVEPWFTMLLSSVLPVVIALYLPGAFLAPLVAASTALFAGSLVMLRRQTVRRRALAAAPDSLAQSKAARKLEREARLDSNYESLEA